MGKLEELERRVQTLEESKPGGNKTKLGDWMLLGSNRQENANPVELDWGARAEDFFFEITIITTNHRNVTVDDELYTRFKSVGGLSTGHTYNFLNLEGEADTFPELLGNNSDTTLFSDGAFLGTPFPTKTGPETRTTFTIIEGLKQHGFFVWMARTASNRKSVFNTAQGWISCGSQTAVDNSFTGIQVSIGAGGGNSPTADITIVARGRRVPLELKTRDVGT